MKRLLFAAFLSVSFFVVAVSGQQTNQGPLTNESVVKLVKAGFKEKTIIAIISNRPNVFKLDPEQLIQLKRQNVNENIILAMLATQNATFTVGDDEWVSDEAFFKGLNRKQAGGESKDSGTNIFGSGTQSRSQSRSGKGGNTNEGSVTGSATVRIIKPPVEGGDGNGAGSAPKLEKTPTLNNEGVIKLVEAGFSEGTIIKRIEESPVDFDLSPGKLDELYKKRVTDAIIAAMATAMGKDR